MKKGRVAGAETIKCLGEQINYELLQKIGIRRRNIR